MALRFLFVLFLWPSLVFSQFHIPGFHSKANLVMPNGNIVMAGHTKSEKGHVIQGTIIIVNSNGNILTKTILPFDRIEGLQYLPRGIQLLPDNKILVLANGVKNHPQFGERQVLVLIRFLENGQIDKTFIGNQSTVKPGYVESTIDPFFYPRNMRLAPNRNNTVFILGRIIREQSSSNLNFSRLVRKNVDGTSNRDKDFGRTPSWGWTDLPKDHIYEEFIITRDGKFILVGEIIDNSIQGRHPIIVVTRLNPDGTIDNDFGKNGHFYLQPSSSPVLVSRATKIIEVIEPESQGASYLIAGDYLKPEQQLDGQLIHHQLPFVLKLNSNGHLDTSFGLEKMGIIQFPYIEGFLGDFRLSPNKDHFLATILAPDSDSRTNSNLFTIKGTLSGGQEIRVSTHHQNLNPIPFGIRSDIQFTPDGKVTVVIPTIVGPSSDLITCMIHLEGSF